MFFFHDSLLTQSFSYVFAFLYFLTFCAWNKLNKLQSIVNFLNNFVSPKWNLGTDIVAYHSVCFCQFNLNRRQHAEQYDHYEKYIYFFICYHKLTYLLFTSTYYIWNVCFVVFPASIIGKWWTNTLME